MNGNNLNDGKIEIKSNTKTVSEDEFNKHKRDLNNRTLLVSINGTIGNSAFYNNEKIMLGKSACYFNLLSEIEKEYIRLLIKSDYFLDYAVNAATETAFSKSIIKNDAHFCYPISSIKGTKRMVSKVYRALRYL